MAKATSSATGRCYGVARVCQVWEVPRSSFYAAQQAGAAEARPPLSPARRGPKPATSEFENELPSGEVHSVEYMSAVGTWCGSVPGSDAARPMDGIVARLQQ